MNISVLIKKGFKVKRRSVKTLCLLCLLTALYHRCFLNWFVYILISSFDLLSTVNEYIYIFFSLVRFGLYFFIWLIFFYLSYSMKLRYKKYFINQTLFVIFVWSVCWNVSFLLVLCDRNISTYFSFENSSSVILFS